MTVVVGISAFRKTWRPRTMGSTSPFARACLLQGVDELGYLLALSGQIDAYEKAHGG